MEREVYYCGCCRRQQLPQEGERCRTCGSMTVSWFTDRETYEEVHRKWERLFGPAEENKRHRQPLWERESQERQRDERERLR